MVVGGFRWFKVVLGGCRSFLRITLKSPESHVARSHVARNRSHVARNS